MMDCRQTKHPLQRQGTHQRERLLQTLIPANVKLDDRSIADLLSYAGEFAKHVRYWNPDNTPGGDWTCFWEKDATPLLAIVAATDLETLRSQYRDLELVYYKLKKEETQSKHSTPTEVKPDSSKALENLVLYIYETARQIQSLCTKVPANNPLKAEIARIIKDKLRQPFVQLIAYHKGIASENLIGQYQAAGFLGQDACGQAWGMTDEDFLCIDYWEQDYDPQALWQLFLAFYKVLAAIVQLAERAFRKSLNGRSDHPPHIALFLSFLHLFRYLQDEINNFTEKHLIYYYHEVLLLQERREIPDRVHLVFELAQNVDRHLLAKGVQFLGGKDSIGLDRFYALEDELVVNRAKLVEKKNLYVWEEQLEAEKIKRSLSVMLHGADMKDGVDKPFEEGFKEWHPLSGKKLYERFQYKLKQINKLKPSTGRIPEVLLRAENELLEQLGKLRAMMGFTISTPELVMAKASSRLIGLKFSFEDQLAVDGLLVAEGKELNILDYFDVQLSTDEGIKAIETGNPTADGLDKFENTLRFNRVYALGNKGSFDCLVVLNAEFPNISIAPDGTIPFIRFVLKDPEKTNFYTLAIKQVTVTTAVNIIIDQRKATGIATERVRPVDQKPTLFFEGKRFEPGQPIVIQPSGGIQEVIVKYDELFLKNLQFDGDQGNNVGEFNIGELQVRFSNISGETIQLLNGGAWRLLSSFDNSNYIGLKEAEKIHIPNSFLEGDSVENGWIKVSFLYPEGTDDFTLTPPLVLSSEDVSIRYVSQGVTIPITAADTGRNAALHQIQYFTSFGEWSARPGYANYFSATPIIEQPVVAEALTVENLLMPPEQQIAHGNLFLGFETITPGQVLSLLIDTAEGSGNPDKIAPKIRWSYLRDNDWVQFPPQFILKDETFGMQRTGILRLLLPTDINNGNSWITGKDGRKDLYWLRASATEDLANNISVEALPMLRDIFPQAGAALFENNGNALQHLEEGIPEKTIANLRFREVKIRSITQPFRSFGGRFSEDGDRLSYYRRIHERLRHRQRAVNVYDYERLLMEAYPKVAVSKCLPHSAYAKLDSVARPGHVQVAVLPYPDKMIGARKFYPSIDAGDLSEMQQYLNRHNSMFVSGQGGAHFCCCESESTVGKEPCNCQHCDNRLQVINARMEPIRLQLCVRFKAGKDIPYYKKQLNEDLKGFLAPWAVRPSELILFGSSVSTTRLLQFVEMLEYVDVVMDLKFKHFYNREQSEDYESETPWQQGGRIEPFTSRSVLTTYLDVLNDENPNVVDHDIHVIDDPDACKCLDCALEDIKKFVEAELIKDANRPLDEKIKDEGFRGRLTRLVEIRQLGGEYTTYAGSAKAKEVYLLKLNEDKLEITLKGNGDRDHVLLIDSPKLKNRT